MPNPSTPFVGGTSVFPNTNLQATPGSASASVEWTDVADVTVTAPITVAAGTNTIGHAASGVTPGTYGDATHIPEVTVEADGHVTAVTVGAAVAPIASPAFTGTPTAPTAAPLTDNTQVATTAYADLAVGVEKTRALAAEALLAPLASPALTGSPTSPTQSPGDNTTKIATDAFVQAAIAASGFLPEAGGTMTGKLTVAGLDFTVTLVNDANYTLLATDNIIIYTALTAIRSITVPSGLSSGQLVFIADGSGNAVSGSKEIQIAFAAPVTFNGGALGNPVHAINFGGGSAIMFNTGNSWIIQGNNWPLWLTSSASVTYNGSAALGGTWRFNTGSTAIFSSASIQITPTVQTISATLTLTNTSPNFQSINGGTADRTVNLPFTGGDWYFIQNFGTTNNLLITTNSVLVYALPPGRSALFVNTSSGVGGAGAQYRVLTDAGRLLLNVDLTAQAAAQSSTALYTTPSNGSGMYRISWAAVVTQAATVSSTLGGANGFQVTYTDNDTGASVTTPAGSTATGNTVGTQLSGVVYVNAKVSTAITISFGYTSSGATAMQYALHVRSEYLG